MKINKIISQVLLWLIPVVTIAAWILFYFVQDDVALLNGYLNLILLAIIRF